MLCGDGAGLVEGSGEEGVVGEAVDGSGQAAGGLEEGLEGGRLEQRELAAGQGEAVGEVGLELVGAEAGQVRAHEQALGEGLVDAHGETAAQFGEADEEQAQAVLGVHGKVGEEPEVLEHVVAQMVGLVDDEHGELLGLADEAGDFGADLAVGGGAGAHGGEAEFPGESLVHVQDGSGRKGDIEDRIEAGMQGGGDAAAEGGLAAAGLAGEQAEAAQFEEVEEAGFGLAGGLGEEQLVGVGEAGEGEAGEGEVLEVHQSVLAESAQLERRGGRFGSGVFGCVGTVGGAGALDAGVGVGVEQGGLAGLLAVVQDRDGSVAGDGGVVQQDDVLADERGVDLVQGALEADGAVLADTALEAVAEERVEIGVGADEADAGGGAGPGVERGFAVEAAVGAEMVLAFAPGGPAGVEGVEAAGVVLAEQGQELHAHGAEEALDLAAVQGSRMQASPNQRECRRRWSSPIRIIRYVGGRSRSTPN